MKKDLPLSYEQQLRKDCPVVMQFHEVLGQQPQVGNQDDVAPLIAAGRQRNADTQNTEKYSNLFYKLYYLGMSEVRGVTRSDVPPDMVIKTYNDLGRSKGIMQKIMANPQLNQKCLMEFIKWAATGKEAGE